MMLETQILSVSVEPIQTFDAQSASAEHGSPIPSIGMQVVSVSPVASAHRKPGSHMSPAQVSPSSDRTTQFVPLQ
jgi:hypothetical protein